MEKIRIFDYHRNEIIYVDKVSKSKAEWKNILTPEQYEITTEKGTEKPFICTLKRSRNQVYFNVSAATRIWFANRVKFHSGTGWPSYYEPVSDLNIRLQSDNSYGMHRTEVLCARCDSHLGHVFDDGPPLRGSAIVSMRQRFDL